MRNFSILSHLSKFDIFCQNYLVCDTEDDNLDDFAFESAEFSTQETKPQHETGPIIKPIIKPLEIQRVQSLSQLPLQSPSRNTLVKSTFIELSSDPQFALQDSQRGELENNCEIDFFNGFGIGDMRVLSAIKCLNVCLFVFYFFIKESQIFFLTFKNRKRKKM